MTSEKTAAAKFYFYLQEVVVVAGPGCVMRGGPQLPDYEPEPPSPADQLSHVNALLASQAALAR